MPHAEPLLLAIDQGTSATKTALVNRAGDVVARGAADLPAHHPRRGWVEQSPAEIWHSLQISVQACLEGSRPSPDRRYGAEHPAGISSAVGPPDRTDPIPLDQLAGPADRGPVPRVRPRCRFGPAQQRTASGSDVLRDESPVAARPCRS